MSESPDLRPLAELLRRIAWEMRELEGLSDALQTLVVYLPTRGDAPLSDLIRHGRAAELLSQRLTGLAALLAALAEAAAADATVDLAAALEGLTLSDHARRLLDSALRKPPPGDAALLRMSKR